MGSFSRRQEVLGFVFLFFSAPFLLYLFFVSLFECHDEEEGIDDGGVTGGGTCLEDKDVGEPTITDLVNTKSVFFKWRFKQECHLSLDPPPHSWVLRAMEPRSVHHHKRLILEELSSRVTLS